MSVKSESVKRCSSSRQEEEEAEEQEEEQEEQEEAEEGEEEEESAKVEMPTIQAEPPAAPTLLELSKKPNCAWFEGFKDKTVQCREFATQQSLSSLHCTMGQAKWLNRDLRNHESGQKWRQ